MKIPFGVWGIPGCIWYLGYSPTAGAPRGASSASSDFSAWKALGTYPGVVAPPWVGNGGYIERPGYIECPHLM